MEEACSPPRCSPHLVSLQTVSRQQQRQQHERAPEHKQCDGEARSPFAASPIPCRPRTFSIPKPSAATSQAAAAGRPRRNSSSPPTPYTPLAHKFSEDLAQAIIDSKIDQNLLRCFSSFFSEKDKEDDVSVDAILSTFPVSYFHYRLMVVCGFAMLVYSMHLSHHARVILEVDPRDVASDAKVAALVLLMPMCEILSGPLWGCAADRYGRRPVTVYSLCFIALGSVVHLTSNAFPALVVAEMCVGLGAGAMSVPFDLLAEFFACPVRLRFLFCMSYCLFLGDVFVSLVYLGFFVEYGWRATSIAVTAFTLMATSICYVYIPESPRWQLMKGDLAGADAILDSIAVTCGITWHASACSVEEQFSLKSSDYIDTHDDTFRNNADRGDGDGVGDCDDEDIQGESTFVPSCVGIPCRACGYFREHGICQYASLLTSAGRRRILLSLCTAWFVSVLSLHCVKLRVAGPFRQAFSGGLREGSEVADGHGTGAGENQYTYELAFASSLFAVLGVYMAYVIFRWRQGQAHSLVFTAAAVSFALLGVSQDDRSLLAVLVLLATWMSVCAALALNWIATVEMFPSLMKATGHSACLTVARLGGLCPVLLSLLGFPLSLLSSSSSSPSSSSSSWSYSSLSSERYSDFGAGGAPTAYASSSTDTSTSINMNAASDGEMEPGYSGLLAGTVLCLLNVLAALAVLQLQLPPYPYAVKPSTDECGLGHDHMHTCHHNHHHHSSSGQAGMSPYPNTNADVGTPCRLCLQPHAHCRRSPRTSSNTTAEHDGREDLPIGLKGNKSSRRRGYGGCDSSEVGLGLRYGSLGGLYGVNTIGILQQSDVKSSPSPPPLFHSQRSDPGNRSERARIVHQQPRLPPPSPSSSTLTSSSSTLRAALQRTYYQECTSELTYRDHHPYLLEGGQKDEGIVKTALH